ncbi:Beta-galactosidase 7, partial [Coemansia sp. RSA 921]
MMSAVAGQRAVPGDPYTVGQSPRGLVIDGQPRVLTTGAIHYPRSAPAMWDSLMKKAKLGGLNTIDTYVFWNMHEPSKGDYDFYTDRANLPLFLQTARENGLFVVLRVGPYVCAEWNYGGFPQWLRHEPDIVFRTYSAPFMREMRRFIAKVVDVTKPYMPEHGGPIIAMQIENEYGDHQRDFGHNGDLFADWCGQTAQQFNLTVPWIMCQQYYRVDGVIPTVNGFYCDQKLDKFRRDNPELPAMWTEMWPGWFQRWGEAAPHRPIEDIAYAVAKWFARGGTSVSYY